MHSFSLHQHPDFMLPLYCPIYPQNLAVKPVSYKFASSSVVVKDLVRVLQDRIHHSALEPRIGDGALHVGAHESGAEHDGQVLTVHPVDRRVLDDTVKVQRDSSKGGVVGIRKRVDDGVERVATDDVIVIFYTRN